MKSEPLWQILEVSMFNLFISEHNEFDQATLVKAGFKFTAGGPHASRTMMLAELEILLHAVKPGSRTELYQKAVVDRNILGKSTDSTRRESFRRLREIYALSEAVPVFYALRYLHTADPPALPLLALLSAWCRDPLLRATTTAVLPVTAGVEVKKESLARAVEDAFPGKYSEKSLNSISRHAASTWSQSGHLVGRTSKVRREVQSTAGAVTMALWLGDIAGYHGAACFSSPWCRLLDLGPDQARTLASVAHRRGLLTLRAVGEVVELRFPVLPSPEVNVR